MHIRASHTQAWLKIRFWGCNCRSPYVRVDILNEYRLEEWLSQSLNQVKHLNYPFNNIGSKPCQNTDYKNNQQWQHSMRPHLWKTLCQNTRSSISMLLDFACMFISALHTITEDSNPLLITDSWIFLPYWRASEVGHTGRMLIMVKSPVSQLQVPFDEKHSKCHGDFHSENNMMLSLQMS